MTLLLLATLSGLIIWLCILLLPWRPWSTIENSDADPELIVDLSEVTVLIPARNEASHISPTLDALTQQGENLSVVLVDDQSTDDTARIAEQTGIDNLIIINGTSPLPGWSGKLWALEQGLRQVKTDYVLLLDADITLIPGLISTLLIKMQQEKLDMVSLMVRLRMHSLWERSLMPAFILFFKLLYPFHLSNKPDSSIAAAAGGFILVRKKALNDINAFESIKQALIDDCTLAKKIKNNDHHIWTGLTHSAISTRKYDNLGTIWNMVTRTAYNQLQYSVLLLLLCTLLMCICFVIPLIGLFSGNIIITCISIMTLALMSGTVLPTLNYYELSPALSFSFPLAGILFLLMTWHSAFQFYFGKGPNWKDRYYSK